jgi:hypothetical protein
MSTIHHLIARTGFTERAPIQAHEPKENDQMTITSSPLAVSVFQGLDLDLGMVRTKLANPEEGEAWSEADLDVAEREYLRFLALCLAYPEEQIVPCLVVDKIWHAHILDTRAYREDCDRVFGFFYDHFPYFGMRSEEDAADLRSAYDRTLALYELNFGDPPPDTWRTIKAAKCRSACKPVKCK